MLKKMMIVAAASVALVGGGVGIASAHGSGHDHNAAAHCSQSNDTTQKHHKGDSVASNTDVQDITGNVFGIQATKPSGALCPSVANGL